MSANQPVQLKEVKVTSLLSGGHQQNFIVKPEAPEFSEMILARARANVPDVLRQPHRKQLLCRSRLIQINRADKQ